MEITQQQVERLCARTGAQPAAARAALEQCSGDLLAAALLLERTGQIPPVSGGTYSTGTVGGEASGSDPGAYRATQGAENGPSAPFPSQEGGKQKGEKGNFDYAAFFKRLGDVLLHLRWEVWRSGRQTVAIPAVLVLVLLCIRFPLGLAALAVCLLLGCRYRLTGPDFPGKDAINSFLDGAYALVADLIGDGAAKTDKTDKRRKG